MGWKACETCGSSDFIHVRELEAQLSEAKKDIWQGQILLEEVCAQLSEANRLLDECIGPITSFANHCRATGYRGNESKNAFDLLCRINAQRWKGEDRE